MAKATCMDDLFDRWSDQAFERYRKLMSVLKVEPLGDIETLDPFTKRNVLRLMKGLHIGIYPRGKAWMRMNLWHD